jgi:RNA polymerase sigma factor (sigma-70 family)
LLALHGEGFYNGNQENRCGTRQDFFGRVGLAMSSPSVTTWIAQLRAGEEAALARLHARYWPQLVALARRRLQGIPGRAADEEDVAQEAFWSFYRQVRSGRELRLAGRHDLLALLTHIIACKAVNQIQHELGVKKRGGGKVGDGRTLEALAEAGRDRSPLEEALLNDCYRHYVSRLPDNLRDFAELYLAGLTHREMAERLGCVERTVERKMARVLKRWQEMGAASLNEEPAGPPITAG